MKRALLFLFLCWITPAFAVEQITIDANGVVLNTKTVKFATGKLEVNGIAINTTLPSFTGLILNQPATAETILRVGDLGNSATDNLAGMTIDRYPNGNIYNDYKTFTGGSIIFRSGAGTELGSARTWLTLNPSTARATFSGALSAASLTISGVGQVGNISGAGGVFFRFQDTRTGGVAWDLQASISAIGDFGLRNSTDGVNALLLSKTGDLTIIGTYNGSGASLTALTAANITNSTTAGRNLLNLTNPGAITFLKVAADNSVSAESASTHRTSLGLAIGTNVQAYDPDLDTWAAITPASGIGTFLATPTLANLKTAITDETTVGWNLLTLANPSAITFLQLNADNTVTAQSASAQRTALSLVSGTDVVAFNGALGTPTSGNLASCTFPTLNQNTSGSAASLSATLAVASGGTNITSYAIGDLLYASGTTTLSKLADVAAGQPLLSGGVTTAPAYAGYTFAGTAARTYTFPTTTATLARTDAAQTFAGVQTFAGGTILDSNGEIIGGIGYFSSPASTNLNIKAGSGSTNIIFNPGATAVWQMSGTVLTGRSDSLVKFSSTTAPSGSADLGLARNAAGILEINTGTAGQWASVKAGTRDSGTTTVTNGLTIGHQSTGTAAAGLGEAILFNLDTTTTADQNAGRIAVSWTTATHASRTAKYTLQLVNNAAALADVWTVAGNGDGTLVGNLAAVNGAFSGTLSATGHTTFEGVTSTGATGTGKLVYDGSPTLVTPVLGAATATTLTASGVVTGGGFSATGAGQLISLSGAGGVWVNYLDTRTGGKSWRVQASISAIGDFGWYNATDSVAALVVTPTGDATLGGGLIVNGPSRLKAYTVATLPAGTQGDTAYVTDATAPTYLGTLTGSGSVKCPVFYNGSAWVSY